MNCDGSLYSPPRRFAEVLGFTDNTVGPHEQVYVHDGPPRSGTLFFVVSKRSAAPSNA